MHRFDRHKGKSAGAIGLGSHDIGTLAMKLEGKRARCHSRIDEITDVANLAPRLSSLLLFPILLV